MSRPLVGPDWATNANYGAGARPWNGQPNKTQPSAGVIAEGFDPENPFFADFCNWVLNNHGLWIRSLDESSVGRSRFIVRDDFTGGVFSTSMWLSDIVGTGGAVNVVDDSANDGFGAAQILIGSSNPSRSILKTVVLPINTGDFYFSARVRQDSGTLAGTPLFGLVSDGGSGVTRNACFFAKPGAVTWHARAGGSASDFDTTITVSATYNLLEIQRVGGVISFAIDGTEVYSVAFSNSLTDVRLFIGNSGTGTVNDFRVDHASLQLFTGGLSTFLSAHEESDNISVASGDTTKTATFANAFSAAPPSGGAYKFDFSIARTDGVLATPGVIISSLTTTDITFDIIDDFQGVISWRAWD